MSTLSAWSYTATATFWRPSFDEFSQPSGYARVVRSCSFKAGGRLALDDMGEEFAPKTTIYLEISVADAPKNGDYLAIGTVTGASPPDNAEVVRSVRQFDPSTFSEGLPDWEVMTG